MRVTLVWQAEGPTARPYKLFLHATGTEGGFLAGADAFFDVPSVAWQAGEYLISEHRFEPGALPAGPVTLLVGLYHEASGERLPSEDGSDAVPLGTVEVGP